MENEIVTTRTKTYRDCCEGELLYQYGFTSIECTTDRIIIKVKVEKHQNWLQIADSVNCAVIMINNWAYDRLHRDGIQNFASLPVIEREAEWESLRQEEFVHADDPDLGCSFDYRYFYDIQNWVMYENDYFYLYVYEMEVKDIYNNGIESQVDALAFWTPEDLKSMLEFLRAWYYRVTGVDEDK